MSLMILQTIRSERPGESHLFREQVQNRPGGLTKAGKKLETLTLSVHGGREVCEPGLRRDPQQCAGKMEEMLPSTGRTALPIPPMGLCDPWLCSPQLLS